MSAAYAKLRRRRQTFVDEYVTLGNATEAIRRAGYTGPRPDMVAVRFMASPEVKAAIVERTQEAIQKAGARHVRFVEEICTLAYVRLTQLRNDKGELIRELKDLPETLLAAAESIEFDDQGKLKRLKVAKTAGLRMLGEIMKAFPQQLELSGPGGGPINTRDVSDLEAARRIAFLLTQGARALTAAQPEPGSTPAG